MLTFKQFITEDTGWAYTPDMISASHLIKWCEENASAYLQRVEENPIFRGFDAPPISFIQTNAMNRRSANAKNYYTIWMDNNPAWKDYPKRSKSLICSTSHNTASGFGETHLIIPADINKIGLCDEGDLWGSFDRISTMMGSFYGMDDFVSEADALMAAVTDEKGRYHASINYDSLCDGLSAVTAEVVKSKAADAEADADVFKRYDKIFQQHGYKNLLEMWDDVMYPEENGFKVTTGAKFKAKPDVEVWTQGEHAVLSMELLRKASVTPTHELYEFIRKYKLIRIYL